MKKQINQIYEHYKKWEDYNAGMYTLNDVLDKDKKAIAAINLLSNSEAFYKAIINVKKDWPVSWDVNMSNQSQNRRAWLGAAACMHSCNCPEYLTRIAWNLLNKDVQDLANRIANKFIYEYEKGNFGVHKNMGESLLF